MIKIDSTLDRILGLTTTNDLFILQELTKNCPPNGNIVEVGTFMGRSAISMALARPDCEILTVDAFQDQTKYIYNNVEVAHYFDSIKYWPKRQITYCVNDILQENIKNFKNIKSKINCKNPQDINYSGKPIDMFFIDASHTNPEDFEYISFFLPFMKKGSILAGHDYAEKFPDVVKNIKWLEQKLNKSVQTNAEIRSSMWWFIL